MMEGENQKALKSNTWVKEDQADGLKFSPLDWSGLRKQY